METSDFIKEVHFNNVKELFDELSPFGKYKYVLRDFVFRGESSSHYKLLPSALREQNKKWLFSLSDLSVSNLETEHEQQYAEFRLLKKFFEMADHKGINVPDIPFMRKEVLNVFPFVRKSTLSNVWIPEELLELAALAQHYGVPTRLIDWSISHMVSLYFAASGALKNGNNEDDYMVLWALNFRHLEFLRETVSRIPLRIIKPTYHRNPNLLAQKGVLSCWTYKNMVAFPESFDGFNELNEPVDRTPLDDLISNYVNSNGIGLKNSDSSYSILLYKFHLPINEARTLYKVLTDYNFGADNIFSGLSGVFQRMKDDALFNSPIL
ncbi:FRG domain-containing protein [Neobacillus drentensis]|uniref:FRG domain-containing protein n=1 Tax=Neobacillus drentensis TaxID=220684 RepID=UPI0030025445